MYGEKFSMLNYLQTVKTGYAC